MRQVPQNLNSPQILLVGSGRLARHFGHYFDLEKIAYTSWSRKSGDNEELVQKISIAEIVLLAISDSGLAKWVEERRLDLKTKICVHFSGALHVEGTWSFHPLMSFSQVLYPIETYHEMHFVIEEGAPPLTILSLPNPYSYLANEKRALYHSLCAMSGNFSVMLWEHAIQRFETDLDLKAAVLKPYMRQIFKNLDAVAADPSQPSVMTGPLPRGDFGTIENHLTALRGDPMSEVYEAFVSAYQKRKTS